MTLREFGRPLMKIPSFIQTDGGRRNDWLLPLRSSDSKRELDLHLLSVLLLHSSTAR